MLIRTRKPSLLNVPEQKNYPLKLSLYNIASHKGSLRQNLIQYKDPQIQPIEKTAPPISLRKKRKHLWADNSQEISRIISEKRMQYLNDSSGNSLGQEALESPKPLPSLEQLLLRNRPRKLKRLYQRQASEPRSYLEAEGDIGDRLETSATLSNRLLFSFDEQVLGSRSQLDEAKAVRKIVNLPKLPFGKHKNYPEPGFVKEYIKETLSKEWFNINHSMRKSPRRLTSKRNSN